MYVYEPLSRGDDLIRVLLVEPGCDDEPLVGHLETISLNDAGGTKLTAAFAKHFEDISYVWGSNVKDHIILLNGCHHAITCSLSSALHQCRLPDQPRALWADSICINQEDLEEKEHHIAMMGRIYNASKCTLICLGTDPQDGQHARDAVSLIFNITNMIQQVFQSPNLSWKRNSFPWPREDDPLVTDARWSSLCVLVNRPWFGRGWVVQEAALGGDASVLRAGVTFPWLDLLRAGVWNNQRVKHMAELS